MPKMKTRRGAAKRFKLTASGRIKRNKANHRHMLIRRSNKAKRKMRQGAIVGAGDRKNVRRMLCV
ncbi:MAG: 50S ribosomal protein L35 [Candidatus Marinimicrobia bacterium]|jgi:large subunit ribosomal protein L35|uniref:50S ribosomal protein L35 n=2 Tax=marine metagenome TaxID=408172 RepID=A0A381YWM7_9ZZZZ|nr:50S ribosomal protein L35 [Candidatus Neomarinimicrobiota bacterium]MEC7849856.1 50S ribosomal protein L35 [Candidatus Neomarinimicrobiota bacterium]|tara:strand:+ start:139 stop:333 length:195 start_codon:yes stop_codon:yes gene_type:complete